MKKSTKYSIIGVIVAVFAVGIVAFATNPEMFQGRFWSRFFVSQEGYWVFRDQVVTVVASPVPTVVTSEVVSDEGPSQVASAVSTPVASSVTVPEHEARRINIRNLPQLRADDLLRFAKEDLRKNPAKYKLDTSEKIRLIELYEKDHPEFIRRDRLDIFR